MRSREDVAGAKIRDMIKAYIPEAIPRLRKPYFLEALPRDGSLLFQTIPIEEFASIITRVDDPRESDFVIAPHEYADLKKHPARFEHYRAIARSAGKRLIISAYHDDNASIHVDGAIMLRPGGYKSRLGRNEIVIPAYVEDVGVLYDMQPIGKGEKPTVGFAGKAGFGSISERTRYIVRNYLLRRGAARQGLYFRRRSLGLLARDPRIGLQAIVRTTFSGNRKTIQLSPDEARREYIENIRDNLFTLAPRGDGNFSFRFFEALAAGRIPILIDTDSALPLDKTIRYDDFIIRVPWEKLDELPERIVRFWDSHTDEELRGIEAKARHAFSEYLYAPAFYRHIFTPEYLNAVPSI